MERPIPKAESLYLRPSAYTIPNQRQLDCVFSSARQIAVTHFCSFLRVKVSNNIWIAMGLQGIGKFRSQFPPVSMRKPASLAA
jgi:hypothetical protein